jgi:glyceraldehyde 3-phosphate dehydrogenase
MPVRVAINGFGLIGRNFLRVALMREGYDINVVAVNDLADVGTLSHLLKHDSILGRLDHQVSATDHSMTVAGCDIAVFQEPDPSALPWGELGVDIVIESTGKFTTPDGARKHVAAGAKKVIVSAPTRGADLTVVMGINHERYDPAAHTIVSNASCAINCLAPMAKVIHDEFGIASGLSTIVHAYSAQQNLFDGPARNLRLARAAAVNVIPLDAAAVRNVSLFLPEVVPELEGKLDSIGMRVPVPAGALIDLVVELEDERTAEQINTALKTASETTLKGILDYSEEPLASTDIIASPASCIVDAGLTVTKRRQAKVIGWFDNGWGYANRLVDLAQHVGVGVGQDEASGSDDSQSRTDERTQ